MANANTAHGLAPLASRSKKKSKSSKRDQAWGLSKPSSAMGRAYNANPSDTWGGLAALTAAAAVGNLASEYAWSKWESHEAVAQANNPAYKPSVIGLFVTKGAIILLGFGAAALLDKKHKTAASAAAGFGVGAAVGAASDGVALLLGSIWTPAAAPAAPAAPAAAAA